MEPYTFHSSSQSLDGSTQTFTDLNEESAYLGRIAICLSAAESSSAGFVDQMPDSEPVPYIDYKLISNLIHLSANNDKRQLKRLDYLEHAREMYYSFHEKYGHEFRGLQDAYAYGMLLEREKNRLQRLSRVNRMDLQYNENRRLQNRHLLEDLLVKLDELNRKRKQVTHWFSKMKYDFINCELPRLEHIGRLAYMQATEGKREHDPTAHSPF